METFRAQKSTPDFDRSDLEKEMRRRKLKALEEYANFSFLVGADKENAELMHCAKIDLFAAGGYFGGLLRSPSAENPPVWIKHHQPHIFKMILKFVSVQTVEEDLTLKDAVALALAADEFLLAPLKSFCASEIKRLVTVETVWNTLNSIIRIPDLPDACVELLSHGTKKCLEHESFLEASEDSLVFLLEMETLAIDSELDLIEAALKLAKTKPEGEEVELMKALIHHLRLLTLPVNQLYRLSKYLSEAQMAYLSKRLVFKVEIGAEKIPASLNLNLSTRSRLKCHKLEFIGEKTLNPVRKVMRKALEIKLVARQNLIVKGIELLSRSNNEPMLEDKEKASSRISMHEEEYQEEMLVSAWITLKGAETAEEVFRSRIRSKKKYNSWFYVDFERNVFVPKGATCRISVRSTNTYQFIPFDLISEYVNKAEKFAAFSKFEFQFLEEIDNLEFYHKSLEEDGDHYFCVKSLSVVPLDEQGCLDIATD